MASVTIGGQRWPEGTTVSVYPAGAVVGGGAPSGPVVTSGVVSGGAVTLGGLTEDQRYVAYANGLGVGVLAASVQTYGDRAKADVAYQSSLASAASADAAAASASDASDSAASVEAAFSTYKTLGRFSGTMNGGTAAALYCLSPAGGAVVALTGGPIAAGMYIDPADYAVSPRTLEVRLQMGIAANGTLPGVTFAIGVYRLASIGSSNGMPPTVNASSQVAISGALTVPTGANAYTVGDFTLPGAAFYFVTVTPSGSVAANSGLAFTATLQHRAV